MNFIENKLAIEVIKRRQGIEYFLQTQKMNTAQIDAQISRAINELFSSLLENTINKPSNKIEQHDVEEVLVQLFKICAYPFCKKK